MAIKKALFKKSSHSAQKEFTDRKEPQEIFIDALEDLENRDYSVLNFYGIGGIGKSALIKHFQQKHCEGNKDIVYGSVNFQDPQSRSLAKTLTAIKESLAKYKIDFYTFELAYTIFWSKKNPESEYKKKNFPFIEEGGLVASALEFVNESAGMTGSLAIGLLNYLSDKTQKISLDEEIKKNLSEFESKDSFDQENDLPWFFGRDLDDFRMKCPDKKIVIFIDTYEALWGKDRCDANEITTDEWVRSLIAELPKVLFVICGRDILKWEKIDADWVDILENRQHILGDLSQEDSQYFLDSCEIKDVEIQQNIYYSSKGVPFYLDLCVDTYHEIKNKNKVVYKKDFQSLDPKHEATVFERFMRYLDHYEQETLYVLAIPRFYTAELFKLLIKEFDTKYPSTAMDRINSFSFVSEIGGKFYIHNLLRESLSKAREQRDKLNYQVNEYLFEFYNKKIKDISTSTITDKEIIALNEASYHLQQFNKKKYLDWALSIVPIFEEACVYKEAIIIYEEAIKICEHILGEKTPDCAEYMDRLGRIYLSLDKFDDAERQFKLSLEIRERFFGKNHIELIKSLTNFMNLYTRKGDSYEFFLIETRIREINETIEEGSNIKLYGEKIYYAKIDIENIEDQANAELHFKRFSSAQKLFEEMLSSSEKALGSESFETRSALLGLAYSYEGQNKYDIAEPLHHRVISISEKTLDHIGTARALINLIKNYLIQKKYKNSLDLYPKVISIIKKISSTSDLKTLEACHDLMQDLSKAKKNHEVQSGILSTEFDSINQLITVIQKKISNSEKQDPEVLESKVFLLPFVGKYDEAKLIYQQILKIKEGELPPGSIDLVKYLNDLAYVYRKQGEFEKAKVLYQRSIKILVKVRGKKHPDLVKQLRLLARVYLNQENFKKAESLYLGCKKIIENKLGTKHSYFTCILGDLARLYFKLGQYSKSEALYLQSLKILEEIYGNNNTNLSSTLIELTKLYQSQKKYDEAEQVINHSLGLSFDYVLDIIETLERLKELYLCQGKNDYAEFLDQYITEKFPSPP